jgi:hypothetical protein
VAGHHKQPERSLFRLRNVALPSLGPIHVLKMERARSLGSPRIVNSCALLVRADCPIAGKKSESALASCKISGVRSPLKSREAGESWGRVDL